MTNPLIHVPALLEIRGLSRSFGGVRAIHSLDLDVPAGSAFGVIGPNGAGKTTLFNVMTGVARPTAGQIRLGGDDITGLAPHRIVACGVARTFQNLRLFASLSVLDNVLAAGQVRQSPLERLLGWSRGGRPTIDRALELLDQFQLAGLRDRPAISLPYGTRRRLEIARALATEPRLLLLDEPAAGMNPVEAARLVDDLRRVRSLGITLLIVEHDMEVVAGLCDRVVVLNFGEKIAEGTTSEIQRDPRVLDAYFGAGPEVVGCS